MAWRRLLSRQRVLARRAAFLPVIGEQQFAGHAGVHQAAGRIETGRQPEGDGLGINRGVPGEPLKRINAAMPGRAAVG
jgi:hypothetical protein